MKTNLFYSKQKGDLKIKKISGNNFWGRLSTRIKTALAVLIGVLILGVLLIGDPSETEKTLEYGEDLKTAIDNFEKQREDFSKDVSNIANDAIEELKSEDPDIPLIVEEWEKGWNALKESMEHLEERFISAGSSSNEYFSKMEQLTSEVTDHELRLREVQKNKDLKQRWTSLYKKTSVKISDVQRLIRKGEDIEKILLVYGLREKVESNINALHEIITEAEQLSEDLEKFTLEGKSLILGS